MLEDIGAAMKEPTNEQWVLGQALADNRDPSAYERSFIKSDFGQQMLEAFDTARRKYEAVNPITVGHVLEHMPDIHSVMLDLVEIYVKWRDRRP
jgi:hypothetical protein